MALTTFFLLKLLKLGFGGILSGWVGVDLGCIYSVIWLALCSTPKLLFLMRGGTRLQLIFIVRRVSGADLYWMFLAHCSFLTPVRERDRALLRSVMVGGVWNGFLLGRVRGQLVPCRFCGSPDGDGHLFGKCTFPPLVEIRENPEFHDLMRMDKAHWPRCLLWHGWLPVLSDVNGASPWALDASEGAGYLVEVGILQVWLLSGVALVSLMRLGLLPLCRIIPLSGRRCWVLCSPV